MIITEAQKDSRFSIYPGFFCGAHLLFCMTCQTRLSLISSPIRNSTTNLVISFQASWSTCWLATNSLKVIRLTTRLAI